ncbi:unnamed protein product [Ectocarpus sp. 12 AP-2014]
MGPLFRKQTATQTNCSVRMVMYTHLTLKKDGLKARGAPPPPPPPPPPPHNNPPPPPAPKPLPFPFSRHQSPVMTHPPWLWLLQLLPTLVKVPRVPTRDHSHPLKATKDARKRHESNRRILVSQHRVQLARSVRRDLGRPFFTPSAHPGRAPNVKREGAKEQQQTDRPTDRQTARHRAKDNTEKKARKKNNAKQHMHAEKTRASAASRQTRNRQN